MAYYGRRYWKRYYRNKYRRRYYRKYRKGKKYGRRYKYSGTYGNELKTRKYDCGFESTADVTFHADANDTNNYAFFSLNPLIALM